MSTVILDTITGKSTATTITIGSTPVVSASANSMTIRGEGSAQTSIQQGLAKQWIHYDQSGTIAIDDSFNTTSITDVSTGVATVTIANDMASINFCVAGSTMGSTGSFNAWIQGIDVVHTASSYRARAMHVSSGSVDLTHCQTIAHGDLA